MGATTMPTLIRVNGVRIVIYTDDHLPPHVHATKDDCTAAFELNCPDGPPTLKGQFGFSRSEIDKLADAIESELAMLCTRWGEIHGDHC